MTCLWQQTLQSIDISMLCYGIGGCLGPNLCYRRILIQSCLRMMSPRLNLRASWQIVHMQIRMLWGNRFSEGAQAYMSFSLVYQPWYINTKTYMTSIVASTQANLQGIQGWKEYGRCGWKIPCNTSVLVVIWNNCRRWHVQLVAMIGLLHYWYRQWGGHVLIISVFKNLIAHPRPIFMFKS